MDGWISVHNQIWSVVLEGEKHGIMLAEMSFDIKDEKVLKILQSHPPKEALNHFLIMSRGALSSILSTQFRSHMQHKRGKFSERHSPGS